MGHSSSSAASPDAASIKSKSATFITDFKSLFKAMVLVSNVLPVFTGFWLALFVTGTSFSGNGGVFLFTIGGSTLLMAGALLLNNWYDADIDAVMDRTKNRPTVTGHISLPVVLVLGIILSAVGQFLLLLASVEAALYAFAGWFTYVFLYTMWSKRRYTMNTLIGSISGAVTPLIGWAAVASTWHIIPFTLFAILFLWQMPHTFSIAMRKCGEYKAAGVAVLPVVRGFRITKRHMLVYIVCLLPLPFLLQELGVFFITIATIVNISWLILALRGFSGTNDHRWATKMFFFSLNHLMVTFLSMILVTLF